MSDGYSIEFVDRDSSEGPTPSRLSPETDPSQEAHQRTQHEESGDAPPILHGAADTVEQQSAALDAGLEQLLPALRERIEVGSRSEGELVIDTASPCGHDVRIAPPSWPHETALDRISCDEQCDPSLILEGLRLTVRILPKRCSASARAEFGHRQECVRCKQYARKVDDLVAALRALLPPTEQEIEAQVAQRTHALMVEQRALQNVDAALADATSWLPIDLSAVDDTPPPSIGRFGNGPHDCLFTPGHIHGTHGESDSGKTWLAYIAIAQEARKGNLSVIVDHEMGASEARTFLRTLGLDDGQLRDNVFFVEPDSLLTDALREQHSAAIDERLALLGGGAVLSLYLVDSVGESLAQSGLSGNDDQDVAAWFEKAARWAVQRYTTAAAVVIDHLPKDTPHQKALNPIGSQRKRASVRTQFWVRGVKEFSNEKAGHSLVIVSKHRGPQWTRRDTIARLDGGPDGIALSPASAEDKKKGASESSAATPGESVWSRVVEYISTHDNDGVGSFTGPGSREIEEHVEGSAKAIRAALKKGVDSGVIVREKKSGYHHYMLQVTVSDS